VPEGIALPFVSAHGFAGDGTTACAYYMDGTTACAYYIRAACTEKRKSRKNREDET